MHEETSPKRNRLPMYWAGAYICTALFCDILEWLLNLAGGIGILLNRGITLLYNAGLFLFFAFRGIPFWHGKRLANNVIGFVVEMIPLLDLLPGKTATAFANVRIVRKEDHEYNERIEAARKKNIQKMKKQLLEEQKTIQRIAMLGEREQKRSARILDLDEERRKRKEEKENEALITQEQTTGTRYQYAQDQFQNYQQSQKAA